MKVLKHRLKVSGLRQSPWRGLERGLERFSNDRRLEI